MRLKVLILVLVAITSSQANTTPKEQSRTSKISRNGTSKISSSAASVVDGFGPDFGASLKFVGYVMGTSGYISNIIIINKYYSVAPRDLTVDIPSPIAVDIFAVGYCDAFDACTTDVFTVKVKEIKPYIGATGCPKSIDCLSLVRTCPAWPSDFYAIPLASSLSPYYRTPGDLIAYVQYDFLNHGGALVAGVTVVAEYCECQDFSDLVLAKHVCATETPILFGTTGDNISGLIVVKFDASQGAPLAIEIVGFIVRIQDLTSTEGGAELILYLGHSDYTDWYTTDANPDDHEYPPE